MAGERVQIVYVGSLADVTFEGGYAQRGVPVDVSEALAMRLVEQRSWQLYDGPAPDDLQTMSRDDLMALADERGIPYTSRVTRDGLIRLIELDAAAEEAADEPDEEES